MSPTVRTILVFLAAATAAIAAAPPVDLPGWASALIAAAAAGFAGLGILPPSWVQSGSHTALKRNRPTRAQEIGDNVKRKHELPVKQRGNSHWMARVSVAGGILGVVFWLAFGANAFAYLHEDNARNYCRYSQGSAPDNNIRYVEDSMGRPHWDLWTAWYSSTRYGNEDISVAFVLFEYKDGTQLAIDVACRVRGSDANPYNYAVGTTAVYWRQ
jgi:hypothetical protein